MKKYFWKFVNFYLSLFHKNLLRMISFKQLYDGLISGEITIDENGHNPFYGWGPEGMLESMRRKIDFWDNDSNMAKRGFKWSDHIITDHIRDTDKHISDIDRDSPCPKCGERLGWIYNHEEKKIVCVVSNLISNGEMKDWFYEYNESRCDEEHNHPQSFDFEVKDEVIFANFFRDHIDKFDEEEKDRRWDYFSLNHDAGRKRLCEYHAKDNIGYQQLGNTSVDIFLSEDNTEILVIEDSYIFDEDYVSDEGDKGMEYEAKEEIPKLGYKYCGTVSCDMWRYMFGNVSDVKEPAGDKVKLKPKKGKYIATNYFGTSEHSNHKIGQFDIASRIKLIS